MDPHPQMQGQVVYQIVRIPRNDMVLAISALHQTNMAVIQKLQLDPNAVVLDQQLRKQDVEFYKTLDQILGAYSYRCRIWPFDNPIAVPADLSDNQLLEWLIKSIQN